MALSQPRFSLYIGSWAVAALLLLGWMHKTSRCQVQEVPDTQSYRDVSFASVSETLLAKRTPVLPALLRVLGRQRESWLPWIHWGIHVFGSAWLATGMLASGLPVWQAWVVALTTLVCCTFTGNVNLISTDALACSVALISIGQLLLWLSSPTTLRLTLLSLTVLLAILIRPSYIFLIGFAPLVGLHLLRLRGASWRAAFGQAWWVGMVVAAPVIAYCLTRFASVGHFHIVAYGSLNLAGITSQFLDESVVAEMSGDEAQFARYVLAARDDWMRGAEVPKGNSYQAIEERWHPLMLMVSRIQNDLGATNAVDRERQLAAFNRAVIVRRPRQYAVWVAKAIRQAMRILFTDMALHPPFLAFAIAAVVGLLVCSSVWPAGRVLAALPGEQMPTSSRFQLAAVPVTAAWYFALGLAPIVLSSAPLGRFVDAVGVLVPASLLILLAPFARAWRRSEP
ncbi:MAG: hypothetical protein KDB14_12340 [Planctomycetales bacterium]|nr:hypothetical protein [Planctomycetales bacterium]